MAFFAKFKEGLNKTRNFLAGQINKIAAGMGRFDEDMLDDLEMALLSTDCGVEASESAIAAVKAHIKKTGDNSEAAVLRVLREALLRVLPTKKFYLQPHNLNILLLVGVNGTGKTTTAGKLAKRYKQDGAKVILAAADTFRAAAVEQLKSWGESTNCAVIAHETGADPAAVVFDAVAASKARKSDLLIIDTAGRLHTKQNLMAELAKIHRVIKREAPDANLLSLLVIDATSGQNAILQAQAFNAATPLDGLIITKLDGNSKGGVAIAVSKETNMPIYFAGLGEAAEDLQDFDSELFIDALLPQHGA